MYKLIGKQYRKPSGFLGKIISRKMTKGNLPVYDKVIPALEIKRHDKILEIGYGLGVGVDRISTAYDCSVTGIDFSELMFKLAGKRNREHIKNGKAELLYGNFLTAEMNPDRFDKIFCINVIYFWEKLNDPFSKVHSLLKADGQFCIFMAHSDFLRKKKFTTDGIFCKYSIGQVTEELRLAGFLDIRYTFGKAYIIKCRK
jgi:cyclopropane fatty-acyl-phospholipid synthase-like methyltransferase